MKCPAAPLNVRPIDAASKEGKADETVLLLLLAMLAIKTTTTTSATGQESCSKGYIACVNKCVGRPSAATQEPA
jgi:hypothetical protein